MVVRCTKNVSFGLFAIDVGTLWKLTGITYDENSGKSKVRISEQKENGVWAEIPQTVFAISFEPA